MNRFSDFGIKPKLSSFTGDKLKIERILNKPITVLDYKIEDSKAKPGTEYLTLHIEKQGQKHVIFTGSKVLVQMIRQVTPDQLPFGTTIVRKTSTTSLPEIPDKYNYQL